MLGGKGVISVVANVLPAEMHRLTELCLRNDFAAAGKLQLELKDFCDAMFCDVNPIPVKTALNLLGCYVHDMRLQFLEFFGRFYKEGGKSYRPLSVETQYVEVMKEDN